MTLSLVETYCVKPLQIYCTGHSSIKVLQMLSASCQVIKQVRDAYSVAFKFNLSHSHKSPCSFLDEVKVCKFCIDQKFFDQKESSACMFDGNGRTDKNICKTYMDVVSSGRKMLKVKFPSKMYTYYDECHKALIG